MATTQTPRQIAAQKAGYSHTVEKPVTKAPVKASPLTPRQQAAARDGYGPSVGDPVKATGTNAPSTSVRASNTTPVAPKAGQAPSGSGVVGFPANGYGGNNGNFDLLELSELLDGAFSAGFPMYDGDVGAEFIDDKQHASGVARAARNPIVLLAALAAIGVVALKISHKVA